VKPGGFAQIGAAEKSIVIEYLPTAIRAGDAGRQQLQQHDFAEPVR
jgi:hypothetical protein